LSEAVVGYVIGKNPAPPSLTLGQNCTGWGTLPEAGGYLDQKYDIMVSMNLALNYYQVISKTKNAKGKGIHALSHAERMLLKPLVERGLL